MQRQIYLQEDVDWHQSNSVRDMVRNHILPRTAGKGVGSWSQVVHVWGGRPCFEHQHVQTTA